MPAPVCVAFYIDTSNKTTTPTTKSKKAGIPKGDGRKGLPTMSMLERVAEVLRAYQRQGRKLQQELQLGPKLNEAVYISDYAPVVSATDTGKELFNVINSIRQVLHLLVCKRFRVFDTTAEFEIHHSNFVVCSTSWFPVVGHFKFTRVCQLYSLNLQFRFDNLVLSLNSLFNHY